MRCTRIYFNGYKRLLKTGCNVDDRLVAFLGPNEAGKTSILQGLTWMDASSSKPLPNGVASRAEDHEAREDSDAIVTATYRLDDEDWLALDDLKFDRVKTTYKYQYWRRRDGERRHTLSPKLTRQSAPFKRAIQNLNRAPSALKRCIAEASKDWDEDAGESPQSLHEFTLAALSDPDADLPVADIRRVRSFAEWLGNR